MEAENPRGYQDSPVPSTQPTPAQRSSEEQLASTLSGSTKGFELDSFWSSLDSTVVSTMGVGISDNDTSADAVTPDYSSSSLSEISTSSEGSDVEINTPKGICSPALVHNANVKAHRGTGVIIRAEIENKSTGLAKTGMDLSHPPMLNPGTTIPTPLNPDQDHTGSQEPTLGSPPMTPTPGPGICATALYQSKKAGITEVGSGTHNQVTTNSSYNITDTGDKVQPRETECAATTTPTPNTSTTATANSTPNTTTTAGKPTSALTGRPILTPSKLKAPNPSINATAPNIPTTATANATTLATAPNKNTTATATTTTTASSTPKQPFRFQAEMPTPMRPKACRKPTQKKLLRDEHFKPQTNVNTDESQDAEILDIDTPNRKKKTG